VTLHSPLAPGEACRSRRQCALEHSCGGGCSRAANFHHIGADSIAGSLCGQNNTNPTCVPGVMEPAQVAMSSSSYGDSMFDQHPSLDPLLPPTEVESAGRSATWPANWFPLGNLSLLSAAPEPAGHAPPARRLAFAVGFHRQRRRHRGVVA